MSASSNSPIQNEMLVVRPSKWTLTIVDLLRTETRRFNELKRSVGISQKTLTITLRELERDGFVTRTMYATMPPRVDYTLTDLGQELLELADGWRRFALRNRVQVETARQRFDAAGSEPAIKLVY